MALDPGALSNYDAACLVEDSATLTSAGAVITAKVGFEVYSINPIAKGAVKEP